MEFNEVMSCVCVFHALKINKNVAIDAFENIGEGFVLEKQ